MASVDDIFVCHVISNDSSVHTILLFQAYAEIESDTPGTVHGVTNTKDGKSSTNANKPQGDTDNTYREHNKTEEDGYAEKKAFELKNRDVMTATVVACIIIYWLFKEPNKSFQEQLGEQHNVKPMPKEAADMYK